MPLPDIPVDAWIADQQQQFRKITDPLFPAFEFEQAAQEMPIPHDYPLNGGPDQWDQARQQEIERQLKDQQAQDEAAQRQREQEIEQQLRAQQQAQEQAATSMATDAGIPTPDTALATFQQAAEQGPSQDNTSTVAFGGVPPQSPEQQFLAQSGSMNQDFFDPDQGSHEAIPGSVGAQPLPQSTEPTPPASPPDNTSSTLPLVSASESAVDNTSSALWPEAGSALTQPPGFLDRAKSNLNILGGQVSGFLNDYSLPHAIREAAEQQQLEREARANADPTDVAAQLLPDSPAERAWRQENPEKAARLDELRQSQMSLAAGASGTMGGGGMAHDAIDAIKLLRAHGFEEAASQAMREMAQKSSMTLEEIQARVLGRAAPAAAETTRAAEDVLPNEVPNPFPLTDEERALNAAADEKARSQPAHGGYLEDPTFGDPEDVAAAPPAESAPRAEPELPVSAQSVAREYTSSLPGMEVVPAGEQHIPGQGNVGDLSPEARARQAEQRKIYEAEDPVAQPITFEETAAQAERVNTPEVRARELEAAPGTRAAEQTALRTEAAGVNEAWAQAQRDLEAFKREHGEMYDDKGQVRWSQEVQQEGAHLVTRLDQLDREVNPSNTAASRMATETARAFTSLRAAISGSQAAKQLERMRAMYEDLKAAGAALGDAANTGVLSPDKRKLLERARNRLRNPSERVTGPGEAAESELDSIAEAARKARGPRPPRNPGAATTTAGDVEESFAEKLGRLKREQGRLEDGGAAPAELERVRGEIEDTLSQIRMDAEARAKAWMEKRGQKPNLNDLPEAERERIINESAGRSTVQRIRSAAKAEISGTAAAKQQESYTRGFEQAIQKQLNDEKKLQSSIDLAVQRRIDRALLTEKNAQIRSEVRNMAGDARDIQAHIRQYPNEPELRDIMEARLREMSDHSVTGDRVAQDLRASFEKQYGQDATRLMGQVEGRNQRAADTLMSGVERRNTAAERKALRDAQKKIEDQKLSSLADQIDFVLKHQNVPGAMNQFASLAADMTAVSQRGFERSQQLKEQLWRANLTQAGAKIGAADMRPIVSAIQKMNPDDPESIRAALATIRQPSLMGAYHELQFIHMLSDPRTHVRNIQGSLANAAIKLFFQNPAEAIIGARLGAKDTGGVGEAITGFGRGLKEGWPAAKMIMAHGINPERAAEAIESMNITRLGQEQLTEYFGKRFGQLAGEPGRVAGEALGTALHMMSTRPLESMDALLGHAMYASKLDQEIERMANLKFSEKLPEYAGMSKAKIKDLIQRNPWDFPQLIDQAQYARDYMLLRAKDKGPLELESALRNLMSKRALGPNASVGDKVAAAGIDFMIPFFNVPLNFAKQGLERSVGAPIYAGIGLKHAAQGHPREAAEAFAKSAVGAAILGSGAWLAGTDNLTGPGPSPESGLRDVWLLDHQPYSYRIPGTKNWVEYGNTPVAIPWGAIAGAKEAWDEAKLRGGKKGLADTEMLGSAVMKGGQGAIHGAFSNTFLEGIQQNFETLALQGLGPSSASTAAANALARYNPIPLPMGTLGFFARVADTMDRDVGRITKISEIPGDIQNRLEARLPGLRNQLPERKNAFGQSVSNPSGGGWAISPFRVGQGQAEGDPGQVEKAQKLEGVGVGMPNAPTEFTVRGYTIPLQPEEQRQYQMVWGQQYSTILDQIKERYPDRQFPDDVYVRARDAARLRAQTQIAGQIGADELRRRLLEQHARVVEPVR